MNLRTFLSLITETENRKRFIKFAMVGLSGVLVNMGLLWLFHEKTNLPFYLCSFLAIEFSILTNFFLNDNWTWQDKRHISWLSRFGKYHASTALTSILINMTVLLFLKEWIGLPYLLANLAGIGAGMIGNFLLNHFWTYGELRWQLPTNVLIVTGISLVVRLFLAGTLGAGFDEAYYFGYSLRPALSYFDHPPVVGFLAGLFPSLTGIANPFTIRLGAILLFTVSSLLLYSFTRKLISEQEAFFTFLFFNITPIFPFGAGIMILPDAGLAFFWILALFAFKKIILDEAENSGWWIWGGVCTGLAMLSKYHGVFLGCSLLLYLVFYRPRWLFTMKPYLYALSALITFSPVLIWNLQHDFISFTFQGSRAAGRLNFTTFSQALIGQAAYLGIIIFIVLLFLMFQSIRLGLLKRQSIYQFIFFWGTLPVLFFNGVALFQRILPHWPMPGYILLMLPLGQWYAYYANKRIWIRSTARVLFGLLLLLLAMAWLQVNHGILHFEKWAERGWIRQKEVRMEGTLDVIGWETVSEYLTEREVNPEKVFLFSNRWMLCGEIELATQGKFPVLCFHPTDPRGYGIWDPQLDMTGRDAVYICTNRYFRDPREHYTEYFKHIQSPDSIPVFRGGYPAKTFYFFRCDSLLKKYPSPYLK